MWLRISLGKGGIISVSKFLVIEISEGVNLDTTSEGKIVGIEILDASKKIDIKTILSYTLELDKKLLWQRSV